MQSDASTANSPVACHDPSENNNSLRAEQHRKRLRRWCGLFQDCGLLGHVGTSRAKIQKFFNHSSRSVQACPSYPFYCCPKCFKMRHLRTVEDQGEIDIIAIVGRRSRRLIRSSKVIKGHRCSATRLSA